MTPTILLLRHSNTTYDKKVDAILNPPLDEQGVERFKRTVKFLDASPYKPKRILSSPLQRALRIAEMLSRGNAKVTTHNEALPWNLGDLQGKITEKVQPEIDMLEAFPDVRAPHGESYRTFFNRWEAFLRRAMQYTVAKPEYPLFITTHSRNINALQTIFGDAPVGGIQEITPEASVTLLTQDDAGDWYYKLIWYGH